MSERQQLQSTIAAHLEQVGAVSLDYADGYSQALRDVAVEIVKIVKRTDPKDHRFLEGLHAVHDIAFNLGDHD